jgi:hypothetical protein
MECALGIHKWCGRQSGTLHVGKSGLLLLAVTSFVVKVGIVQLSVLSSFSINPA